MWLSFKSYSLFKFSIFALTLAATLPIHDSAYANETTIRELLVLKKILREYGLEIDLCKINGDPCTAGYECCSTFCGPSVMDPSSFECQETPPPNPED